MVLIIPSRHLMHSRGGRLPKKNLGRAPKNLDHSLAAIMILRIPPGAGAPRTLSVNRFTQAGTLRGLLARIGAAPAAQPAHGIAGSLVCKKRKSGGETFFSAQGRSAAERTLGGLKRGQPWHDHGAGSSANPKGKVLAEVQVWLTKSYPTWVKIKSVYSK